MRAWAPRTHGLSFAFVISSHVPPQEELTEEKGKQAAADDRIVEIERHGRSTLQQELVAIGSYKYDVWSVHTIVPTGRFGR